MAEPTIPLCPAMYILDVGDNIVFGFLIAIPDHGHLCLYPYISALSSPKVKEFFPFILTNQDSPSLIFHTPSLRLGHGSYSTLKWHLPSLLKPHRPSR